MATVSEWTPFGVALDITATVNTVNRTSSTAYTVKFNVSWKTHWSTKTDYGMTASSGGGSVSLNSSGTKAASGSGTFTGTFSTTANVAATKTVTVTFRNYNTDHDDSATKGISLSVNVPAWTSYTVKYNANGGSGAPSSQTKWKDKALTLSTTKPTRTGYSFQGWATSSTGSVAYAAGASYTSNASVTLYAVWKANTYTVSYSANGGSGAPANQTKTYGVALTLSSTKPTRTNYNFKGWGTSAGATTVAYASGASYTANAAITLYAIWELAYTKPRISNYSVARCDSSGTVSDSGTYALVKFNWATDKTISAITIKWKLSTASSYSSSTTVTATGTSGSVSQVVGAGGLNTETTYNIQVIVEDDNGSSVITGILQGMSFPIDFKGDGSGVSFGKPAELSGYMDVAFKARFNDDVSGPVIGLTTGTAAITNGDNFNNYTIPGVYRSGSSSNTFTNHPGGSTAGKLYVIAANGTTMSTFNKNGTWLYIIQIWQDITGSVEYRRQGIVGSTAGSWTFTAWTKVGIGDYVPKSGGTMTGTLRFENNIKIYGAKTDGTTFEAFNPCNSGNNLVIGYGLYANKSGNLNIYGHDINHYVSNIAEPGGYRPYRRQGDSLDISIKTSGYVTNGGTDVYFFVPFSVPIVGAPTVTAVSTSGFILRQGNAYTHGSAASTYVTPTSYLTYRKMYNGVLIVARFSSNANVTNNDAIGVHWEGTIIMS